MPGGGCLKKFYSYIVFALFCVSIVYSNDFGCTDQNACNYDLNAIEDDGSCLYLDCLNECGGLNYDCCDDLNSEDFSNCPIDVICNDKVQAGKHQFKWNAKNYSSGIYLLKVKVKVSLQLKN